MSIICFEGASAVGKTTTANCFKANYGAFVVPEVNQLFNRPEDAPAEWYFERQVERWSIAQEQSKFYHLVILDGDPFQTLWYCWAYDFAGWQSLNFMEQFYKPRIQNKTIGFPDLYFVFSINEVELRKRKASDMSRRRHGFETHLKMIEPQRRYFQAMQAFSPNRVLFLSAVAIETNIEFVRERISVLSKHDERESEALIDKMIQWLRENEA
ncbi:AAA family ATPase [Nostoc sp. CHAB 5715]|uniref:AAA family ATPase n=1 Tax=Nostoc sp. CHAB 5715 TaxID=2780400 RepID=UPI001E3CC751|nr:AAA family ATPase [Nostoc sp. CHAB 5715]MCC5626120.1 AAA family ATPase [Nostoc sp. CHAB 5715]